MGILDFFGREAGQRRRAALDEFGRSAEQYVPPELRQIVGLLSDMTPTAANERAAMASDRLFQPDRTVGQRVGDFGEMASEIAGVVAPVAVAGRAGMPAAEALQEALMGFSAGSQQAGQAILDRANQPGPVPTMYSNPLMGGGNVDARTSVAEMRKQANIDRFGYDPNEVPDAPPGAGLLSDYVGEHQAPMRYGNAPAFDLAGDIYPDDIYSSKAVQYYGTGDSAMDIKTMGLLQSLRGQPDAAVTIYRAVPRGVDDLNAGDWVTVNKQYAQDHGEAALGGDFNIVEREVKASEIFTNGDSIHEFGYDPLPPAPSLPAPRNEAEAMAQKVLEMRAAGNAGDVTEDMMALADDQYMYFNTPLPMDEASRMARSQEGRFTTGRDRQDVMRELRGLNNPHLVHYTNKDFSAFRIPERENRQAVWATPDPSLNLATKDNFQTFSDEGVVGLPIMARMEQRVSPYEFRMAGDPMTPGFPSNVTSEDVARANSVGADHAESGLEYAIFDPANIRSRFARFDPEFRHLRNLSAGVGGLGLLGMSYPPEEQY